jgi:MoxR-like ATPase
MNELVHNEFTNDLEKIIKSKIFFPIFITGPTGCGKTFPVKKICEQNEIKHYFVSVTKYTDEHQLIGGFRLLNGSTVYEYGPVIRAMKDGTILLLDELDLADPTQIMCLQNILLGDSYYISQTSEIITPSPGFNIIATGNTMGLGDVTGAYIGTNIFNEAFLDRFHAYFNVNYMSKDNEIKVISNYAKEKASPMRLTFIENLVEWAHAIRKGNETSNDITHTISTRKLIHAVDIYKIFTDEKKTINVMLSRFENHILQSFFDLYVSKFPFDTYDDMSLKYDYIHNIHKDDIEKFKKRLNF